MKRSSLHPEYYLATNTSCDGLCDIQVIGTRWKTGKPIGQGSTCDNIRREARCEARYRVTRCQEDIICLSFFGHLFSEAWSYDLVVVASQCPRNLYSRVTFTTAYLEYFFNGSNLHFKYVSRKSLPDFKC